MSAIEIQGIAFKQGSAVLLARVVGWDGQPIKQADINTAKYTVYLVDPNNPDSLTPVEGHEDVSMDVSGLIYDTLQTDDLWDVDDTGYNFKHVVDVSSNQAFPTAGRSYQVRFELMPVSGQVIVVRFRVLAY